MQPRTAPDKRTTIRLVGLANREVHTKQRFKNQNLRLQKTRIPTAGSVFLKCPFNGKAGPLILDSRHDDSGAPRSIFAEKPRKTASVQGHCKLKGRRKTPILMQENTENEGKTTSRAEKCHGGSLKRVGQKRTFKESQRAIGGSFQNTRKDLSIGKQANRLPA